jgi:hypothetical protein
MQPLASHQIRVRRRPGAILMVWGTRTLAAWLVADPVARAVAAAGIARFPEGDALLFEPGGAYLVETARLAASTLVGELGHALEAAALLGVLMLLPLAALLVALAHGGRLHAGKWAGRAFEQFPAFLLFAGVTLLVQGSVAGVFGLAYAALKTPLRDSLTAPQADLTLLAVLAVGAAVIVAAGIVQDLVRAAAVRRRKGPRDALLHGLHTARARPAAALGGWLLPAVWSIAIVGAAALLTAELQVERGGNARLFAVLATHQLAVIGLVALRALWLARALALVSPSASEPDRPRNP